MVSWRSTLGAVRTGVLVSGGVAASTIAVAIAIAVPGGGGGGGGGTCDLNATTANFTTQVAAATAGQTVCLATGSYGTWTGTSKAITVKAGAGQSPTIALNFSSGGGTDRAHPLVIDGMAGVGASGIDGSAAYIQIKNSTFTDPESLNVDGSGVTGIVVGPGDHFDFFYTSTIDSGPNSKLAMDNIVGTIANPAVLVEGDFFTNGDLDAIDLGGDNGGTGSSGAVIVNNIITNICQIGVNHTDNVQFDAAGPGYTNSLIAGNLVRGSTTCGTQTITSFDAGTCNVTVTDNVVDVGGYADGFAWQGDGNCTGLTGVTPGSDITHNTLIFYPSGSTTLCHDTGDGGRGCGQIKLDTKVADIAAGHAGNHTRVVNNALTYVDANTSDLVAAPNGYSESWNLCKIACDGGSAQHEITGVGTMVGGSTTDGNTSSFTTFAQYALAPGSPGYHAGSDGLSMGITGVYIYP